MTSKLIRNGILGLSAIVFGLLASKNVNAKVIDNCKVNTGIYAFYSDTNDSSKLSGKGLKFDANIDLTKGNIKGSIDTDLVKYNGATYFDGAKITDQDVSLGEIMIKGGPVYNDVKIKKLNLGVLNPYLGFDYRIDEAGIKPVDFQSVYISHEDSSIGPVIGVKNTSDIKGHSLETSIDYIIRSGTTKDDVSGLITSSNQTPTSGQEIRLTAKYPISNTWDASIKLTNEQINCAGRTISNKVEAKVKKTISSVLDITGCVETDDIQKDDSSSLGRGYTGYGGVTYKF